MAAPGIDIDDDSVKLILELQLADLKELSGGQSGDGDFATAAYYSDLESLATFSADRAMCESMSRAIAQDRKIINSDEMRDNRASTTAPNVAQNRDEPENGEAAVSALINEEWLDKLEALYVGTESYAGTSHINGHDENPAEVNRILTKDTTRRCISCLNDMPYLQVARCPCSHEYCLECLVNLFRSATKDESLYPPRCCLKTIGLDVVQIFLPSDLVQTLREKHVEFSTINRIYCYDPSCSTFINPEIGIQGHEGTCPACQSKTCVLCKTALHQGEDCPDDTATQEVLQMASAEGWQRCNACRRLIELDTGCHHMSEVPPPPLPHSAES